MCRSSRPTWPSTRQLRRSALQHAGEVVGINSQIFSTSGGFMGLSFAIPIDLAMQIKDQLVKDGRVTRGYVGVFIQEIQSGARRQPRPQDA